jgi:hypothetical protein
MEGVKGMMPFFFLRPRISFQCPPLNESNCAPEVKGPKGAVHAGWSLKAQIGRKGQRVDVDRPSENL